MNLFNPLITGDQKGHLLPPGIRGLINSEPLVNLLTKLRKYIFRKNGLLTLTDIHHSQELSANERFQAKSQLVLCCFLAQPAITCSKLTVITLEQSVNIFHSFFEYISLLVLVFLLLTFKM